MKYTLLKFPLLICFCLLQVPMLLAQDGSAKASEEDQDGPKFRFNGLGRTILAHTGIDGNILEADTSTIQSLTDGEFLLDLAMNATPNEVTEVQAILRLRNEFGGFFGSGMSVEVRELWARGIIANVLKYRVGDMDLVMSPYTLFNAPEEGMVNEAAAFQPFREVVHYEQFYTDANTRRLQGAKLDFGLDFTKVLYDAKVNAFAARVRGTDFFTIPSRFVTGGQAQFSTQSISDSLGMKADFGLNLVHTFDELRSGEANDGIRNTVYTVNYDLRVLDNDKMAVHVLGETGQSNLEFLADSLTVFTEDDSFLDVGAKLVLKPQKLTVSASFVDVGPDFFSIGAQSKRVNYNATKSYYNRLGKDNAVRAPGLFDLTRDRALYTFQLSDRLMDYDPRFSNTMPYGQATPNRKGLRFGINHGDESEIFELGLSGAFMSEIRGQGTFELKQFTLLRAAADFNAHHIFDWNKTLRLTLGYQYETVDRGGLEVEVVDLTSNLIEVGLEAELFENFDILLGAKLLSAEGREYIPEIEMFNDVQDFPAAYDVSDSEQLIAAGLKYQFKKGIYLTIQYQTFQSQLGTDATNDFNLNQVFVIYNMNF